MTPEDLKHVPQLRILTSFIDSLPLKAKRHLRYLVALFQHHILLGVTALRIELQMLRETRTPRHSLPRPSVRGLASYVVAK